MTPSSILVLSSDNGIFDQLRCGSEEDSNVIGVMSAAELNQASRSGAVSGVVLDFRHATAGGHAEAEILNNIPGGQSRLAGWVITPTSCPEPILRAAAGRSFKVVNAEGGVDRLRGEILTMTQDNSDRSTTIRAATAPERDDNASDVGGYSLTGLTRRFETDTPKLRTMLNDLETAARHDVTILLVGETGSGKTYLSRLLHEISSRRSQPFQAVSCGALPNDMLETELFGQARNPMNGAPVEKEGRFAAAGSGTLLLDEIDVLGLDQQVKLLRVIESGEFEPVGSNVTQRTHARLIVASDVELEPLVEQRRFRPDLYYRLNMLKFEIPPLRKRPRDIVPLARKFIRQHAAKHGIAIRSVDPSLFAILQQYTWPGNVRELEHVLQRAVIFCRDGHLSSDHLPLHVVQGQPGPLTMTERPSAEAQMPIADFAPDTSRLQKQREVTEREAIEQALRENSHSRKNTARALGISRVTLYNKMKKYGIIL